MNILIKSNKLTALLGLSLYCFVALSSESAYAIIKHPTLKVQNRKQFLMQQQMLKLEQELSQKNQQYLEQLSKLKTLDLDIANLSNSLMESSQSIASNKKELEQLMHSYLTAYASEGALSQEQEDLLTQEARHEGHDLKAVIKKQILRGKISEQKRFLEEEISKEQSMQKELKVMKERFFEYTAINEELSKLLVELENQKRALTEGSPSRSRVVTASTATAIQATTTAEQFSPPIAVQDALQVRMEKKGFVFEIAHNHAIPVAAIGDGKVVYVGALSTYGNIVIVDHGADLRSITLGNFRPMVSKDDRIHKGSALGKTIISESGSKGQVYLEIRKQDLIQNVSYWASKLGLQPKRVTTL
ncbi:MAG: peptidoglycan DD-metalloendopeptidase family protein [Oligoflexia bacterium]|nr:peptidoglycan DD-metalloendopeptidase family protein [Oligoflexia bacterium]MBF0365381.1 peptidoglycan DD-metalloendopeptidase family protein [Oligoflexia bacterium]